MTAAGTMTGFAALEAVVSDYLDALYTSDSAKLATVFHPAALYITTADRTVLHRDMATYLPIVAAREAPAASQAARDDRLLSLVHVAPTVAVAVVECILAGVHYTDALTLLLVDERWQIVAKVFHGRQEAR